MTIANAAVIWNNFSILFYYMQGMYGSLFGLAGGIIGIRLSFVNEMHQIKCLWIAFIILVCIKPNLFLLDSFSSFKKCVFSSIGAMIAFGFGVALSISARSTYRNTICYGEWYECDYERYDSDKASIPQLLAIETFLSLGKYLIL